MQDPEKKTKISPTISAFVFAKLEKGVLEPIGESPCANCGKEFSEDIFHIVVADQESCMHITKKAFEQLMDKFTTHKKRKHGK